MTRKRFAMILLVLVPILFSGCIKDYDKEDIEKYVRETYGITKFAVSNRTVTVIDDEDYRDILWTAKTADGLLFHVIDDRGWGLETPYNSLWSDFEEVVLFSLTKEYEFDQIWVEHEQTKQGMEVCKLMADFSTPRDLEDRIEELDGFFSFLEQQKIKPKVSIDFQGQNPLRKVLVGSAEGYELDYMDIHNTFRYDKDLQEYPYDFTENFEKMLLTAADYRFADLLAYYTEEEIDECIQKYRLGIGLLPVEQSEILPEEVSFYEGLCSKLYGYDISFGTLYEVLVREQIPTSGDAWHYSFTGADGHTYEISYDFHMEGLAYNGATETSYGYYYLKDGEVVPMEYFFYTHFSANTIKEMLGKQLIFQKSL